ncbi:uracil-xanthine permease family protein [Enterococcus sp. AZ103]|uniref:uracil-xanthine permease family protein n=1 Tax=Enterococcus sp. AZ103 TaxID=2774628 RepID=UPI003F1FC40F
MENDNISKVDENVKSDVAAEKPEHELKQEEIPEIQASVISDVDEKLPLSKSIPLGFQHTVIAVLAAIPVPLIIGSNVGLSPEQSRYFVSAIIFTAGISSILAAVGVIPRTSPKIPMIMGANFAVITVVSSALSNAPTISQGFQVVAGSTMVAGLFCFLISGFWAKLQRFFPPIVVGTNLMVLGTALLPNTFHWMMADNAYNPGAAMEPRVLGLAFGVFLFHVIISKYLKGILGNLTLLIALLVGTIAAGFMGMVDFSSVSSAPWFGLILPFHYGVPRVEFQTTLAFLIVMILGMVEVSGTSMGIHDIANKEMTHKQFGRTLKTLGINTFASGLFNGVQPTAFIQNVGVLDLSKVTSRFTTAIAGGMLLLIGLVPKFSALISAIPKPVLGGLGFAIFGIIIGSAVNLLKQVDFNGNQNMLIIGIAVGIGMLPEVYPSFYANFPEMVQMILGSGILSGALAAILLNMFFNFKDIIKPEKVDN